MTMSGNCELRDISEVNINMYLAGVMYELQDNYNW